MDWERMADEGVSMAWRLLELAPLAAVIFGAFRAGDWWHGCQDRWIQLKQLEVTRVERQVELARAAGEARQQQAETFWGPDSF